MPAQVAPRFCALPKQGAHVRAMIPGPHRTAAWVVRSSKSSSQAMFTSKKTSKVSSTAERVSGEPEAGWARSAQHRHNHRPAECGDRERHPPEQHTVRVDQREQAHQTGQREVHRDPVGPAPTARITAPVGVPGLHDGQPQAEQGEADGGECDVEVLQTRCDRAVRAAGAMITPNCCCAGRFQAAISVAGIVPGTLRSCRPGHPGSQSPGWGSGLGEVSHRPGISLQALDSP